MIDIHTHILYACDDGSTDIETSIESIQSMAEEGVTDIVLTPHFIKNQYHNSRMQNVEKVSQLRNQLKIKNIPVTLHVGAEIYLSENTLQDIHTEQLMINDTNYVLLETAMSELPVNFFDLLYDIVRQGYRPILAHPERYTPIMNHLQIAEDLLYRNVYLQLNIGSFMGRYGRKVERTAWKLLDHGFAHFLATDNHCKSLNYPIKDILFMIEEKYDHYLVELLTKINPAKLLKNEKINFFYVKNVPISKESIVQKVINKVTKILH